MTINATFIDALIEELPKSTNESRKIRARRIIDEQMAISELMPLLEMHREIQLYLNIDSCNDASIME